MKLQLNRHYIFYDIVYYCFLSLLHISFFNNKIYLLIDKMKINNMCFISNQMIDAQS